MTDSPVTITLIFANVAIFFWSRFTHHDYFYEFAEWPYQIVHKRKYYQIITSGFLHVDIFHLLFNMFTLFSFGMYLEKLFVNTFGQMQGSLQFFLIYTISLLSGSLLTVLLNFKKPGYVAVGASGAVSGIVFSYILFFPTATIGVFFIPMPAFVFAFLYVGVSVYGMRTKFGNIGHEAHLGGAIGGIIATFLLVENSLRYFLSHFS